VREERVWNGSGLTGRWFDNARSRALPISGQMSGKPGEARGESA
jgi:hypothetical protein